MNNRNFKPIADTGPTDDQIAAFAQRRGVPSLQPVATTDTVPAKSVAPTAAQARMALDLPAYLHDALKRRALDERCSTRFVILKALRNAGFDVADGDMVADGRRTR